jgi:hypothetical protein
LDERGREKYAPYRTEFDGRLDDIERLLPTEQAR